MNKPTLFKTAIAALVAAAAIGCAPSTAPANGGTADKPIDDGTKVSQKTPTSSALAPDTASGAPSSTTTTTTQGATGVQTPGGGDAPPTAGGGQRGGGGGGRGFGLGFLATNDQFKKELGITDEQAKKIQALIPARPQGGAAGGAQAAPAGGGQQMTPEERQKQRDELETKIKAILTPAQKARIQEIQYQMMGARAFSNPDVVKALGITADQTKKIEALMPQRPQGGAPGGQAAPGGAAPGGGQQMTPEERQKQREETLNKVLAVLTQAQKAKWTKMTGKPFKFVMPQRPSGGGNSTVPK